MRNDATASRAIGTAMRQPYPVTPQMLLLLAIVPLYIFIPEFLTPGSAHVPALPLDRSIPLAAGWALVYGCAYLFLILLAPILVRSERMVRRMFSAYLFVWVVAEVCFIAYPTIGPRPPRVAGAGFVLAGLRFLYAADTPWNCLPSLHVAHSCVSAFTASRVHRGVGAAAAACAALVALSTLFTKQHYVLDVVTGAVLATIAYALFLRGESGTELERQAAPTLAAGIAGAVLLALTAAWIGFRIVSG